MKSFLHEKFFFITFSSILLRNTFLIAVQIIKNQHKAMI